VATYSLVTRLLLPGLSARLSVEQVGWLHQAFVDHPAGVLAALMGISAVLALPVILVFRWVYGPFRPSSTSGVPNNDGRRRAKWDGT
jgi:hypothetical protein